MSLRDLTLSFSPTARPVPLASDVTVYADEQGSSDPSAQQDFAVGCVVETEPILASLVARALAAASADARLKSRGYFHASKDCRESHAALGAEIKREEGDFFFSSLRWRFEHARTEAPRRGELHRHTLSLILSRLSHYPAVNRIELRFARCKGLSEETLNKWFEEDIDARLHLQVTSLAAIPMRYPLLIPREVEPREPGVQVVDRLLWSEQRPAGASTDLDQLGFQLEMENAGEGPFTIRHYVRRDTMLAPTPHRPRPRAPQALQPGEPFFLLAEIERAVHRIAAARPPHLRHLERRTVPAATRLRGRADICDDHLEDLWRAFLLLVDTAPLYTDASAAQAASDAALLAAKMVRKQESWTVTLSDAWRMRRAEIIRSDSGGYLFGAT